MGVAVIYFASPNNQLQAEAVVGKPVLLSFALYSPWIRSYQHAFGRLLIDSGAYSVFNSGKSVSVDEYRDWAGEWHDHADAVAGLDDISGDWRTSVKNYESFPQAFPTMHDSDPPELLKDLVEMSLSGSKWLGIGLTPPREGKERFVRWVCDSVPDCVHVHGWALRTYSHIRRIDSMDSTNWWRDSFDFKKKMPWLTAGECLDIVSKRYEREPRMFIDDSQSKLF